MRFFLFIIPIIFVVHGYCQSPPEQDWLGAIPINKDTIEQLNSYFGQGNNGNEINGQISCMTLGELNDVWYSYCVKTSGDLCFSIIPNDLTDDYDWAVFNLTSALCDDIYYDSSLEVSCNYAGLGGITGPNGLAGSQNNPCIPVSDGEFYVINIKSVFAFSQWIYS